VFVGSGAEPLDLFGGQAAGRFGVSSGPFAERTPAQLTTAVDSALATANHVSIFTTGFDATGGHLSHGARSRCEDRSNVLKIRDAGQGAATGRTPPAESSGVLTRLLDLFRRPSTTARHRPGAAEVTARVTAPATMDDILKEAIDALGGPMAELDRDAWTSLARQIGERAEAHLPPPPSLPNVVGQALALAKQPELDVNELVGILQRDAAIATAMLRIANSSMLAPAAPITTVRGAVQSLGLRGVVEVVLGTAGKSFYAVASRSELTLFPDLWNGIFDNAIANAFTCGRLALDVQGARSERALLAGLLSDIGRPLALRILAAMVHDGAVDRVLDPAIVLAALDEVAPAVSRRTIAAMNLPEELRVACVIDDNADNTPSSDAQIAQLVSAIGAIQRRSPRLRISAMEVQQRAARLALGPLVVRTLFAQRSQYMLQASEMFGSAS